MGAALRRRVAPCAIGAEAQQREGAVHTGGDTRSGHGARHAAQGQAPRPCRLSLLCTDTV